jgi:phospholipase/carboxylesterase
MGGPGREWFPLTFRDPNERWRGVAMAMPGLVQTITDELGRLDLTTADLALVGFSQGTMMALHAGLRLAGQPAAILGYSGLLVGPEGERIETMAPDIRQRPPVLLVHGTDDDVIPAAALFQSANGLIALDIPVQWHLSAGVGHGIDEEGLYHGAHFLERAFTKPSSSR